MISQEATQLEKSKMFRTLNNKLYFDEFYDATVIRATLALRMALNWFDMWVVDGLVNASAAITRGISFLEGRFDDWVVDGAVNGLGNLILWAGARLRGIQTGRLQTYVVLVLAAILVLMVIQMI